MLIGEKIKATRKKHGYTQEQLAHELSVSRQTITNWEIGRVIPDDNKLDAIATLFNISVEDLINENISFEEQTETKKVEEVNSVETQENIEAIEKVETIKQPETTNNIKTAENVIDKEKTIQENDITTISNTTNSKILSKINKRSKKILIALSSGVSALILLIILITVVVPFINQCVNMNKAEKLMNSGDYITASEIYSSINSEKAQEKYNECIYTYANNLHNNGDYENAISQIDSITYKDSNELSKAWNYEYALYNIKIENYTKAIELLETLDDYNNSNLKLKELCNYYGAKLYNAKNFKDAVTYLEKFSKDSDLYNKALYNYAIELNNNGNLAKAYNIFQDLAKIPYGKSIKIAEGILKYVFFRGGNVWSCTPYGTNNLFQYTFYKNQFFMYLTKSNKLLGSFTFNSTIFTSTDFGLTDAKESIILVGINSKNKNEIVILTFNFTNNSKVYIHSHYLSDSGKCSTLCGSYTAEHELDLSSYTAKYKFDFEKTKLPKLHFASEIEQISTKTDDTNIQPTETTTSTKKEQNTTALSSETSNNPNETEPNTHSKNNITNSDTTKESKKTSTNSNKNTQKPSTTSSTSKNNSKTTVPSSSQVQNNTRPNTTSSNPCANGHTWKELTSTVHHEETGHYEDKEIAYKVDKYKCAMCYKKFNSLNEYYNHFDNSHTNSLNSGAFRELYEIVDDWEYTYEKEWVVDTKEYDETIITGYKCSVCGKTKN